MRAIGRRMQGLATIFVIAWVMLGMIAAAHGQLSPAEDERLRVLSEPEAIKKKADDKNRPPLEFFLSKVAPFDVLPYVKANHWCTLFFELRANGVDYEGFLQTDPVKMLAGAQQVTYRREARLINDQRATLSLQAMVPAASGQVSKEMLAELIQANALRPDANWSVTMTTLPPHQMLVLILSKDATEKFAAWNRMSAVIPAATEREGGEIEKQRYYRLVLPMDHAKPSLSSHPLTWTTISHAIWDGYRPDDLSASQQQALLDWIHWGGQLIISGGAGQSFSLLAESFLGPYLPADATAETVPLAQADLGPLSESYPPPSAPATGMDDQAQPVPQTREEAILRSAYQYHKPVAIQPAPKRPVYLSVLKGKPGSSTIPLGVGSPHPLAIEHRVGRGRITMLTIDPNEDSLLAWPGLDTLVRRVLLRRPEEQPAGESDSRGRGPAPALTRRLLASDLSWYRIMSRDADRGTRATNGASPPALEEGTAATPRAGSPGADPETTEDAFNRRAGIAEWRDGTRLPKLCNELLDEASGITIPSSNFVLRVILAYLIAVIPLNWLICRFVLNRREWTWVVVPLVALAFAIGVERVAARDLGYDTAADEIDLLEIYGNYSRGHLTRLVSVYSTGRSRFTISYPNDPTAVALPFDSGRAIRGEDVSSSTFQSYPVPVLAGLVVQPRSLSMFRAEQMLSLAGPIHLEEQGGKRRLVNDGELELRDAVLIDQAKPAEHRERWLGTIAPGAAILIDGPDEHQPPDRITAGAGPDADRFLAELRTNWEPRDENKSEIRLVAWVAKTTGGQVIEPAVDRLRGFTAVVVHLRSGSPPDPQGRRYNRLAEGDPAVKAQGSEQIKPRRFGRATGSPFRGTPPGRSMPPRPAPAVGPNESHT